MKRNYFTTGEFAKICGVNKQTLFYYDSQGIFTPDIVAENGYRYYSYGQLETFTVLLMLRDLGVSIKEIKLHMDNRSPEALIELLDSKSKEIDKKMAALRWSKNYIDKKITVTKEGMNAKVGVVTQEYMPERLMVTSDYAGISDDMAITTALGKHLEYCNNLGLYNACPIGGLIPRDSVTKEGYRYSKFYTVVDSSDFPAGDLVAPSGTHLIIYDNEGYKNIHKNCLKIMDYASSHHLTLSDNFYEDVILDDLSTEGYFNYLVKLSIPVHK